MANIPTATMARLVATAVLTLSTLVAGVAAQDLQGAIDTLTFGQPPDVTAFVARRVQCNHLTTAEPYDTQRAAEMAEVVQKLDCETLDSEERGLRRRYAKRRPVLHVLDKADILY